MESNDAIAPFVMKTYQMVNDPSSDNLIRWGKSGNSFIVVDSLHFSNHLLPAFFKHSNFSSFIRQLNTYGFRKVDTDRCEFANEWFLKGQMHLLKNIGRKRQSNARGTFTVHSRCEDDEEYEMAVEIARLKEEQTAMENELVRMNKRLDTTERRPEKMMALLCKLAGDPEILPCVMLEKDQNRPVDRKRQRPVYTSPASSMGENDCRFVGSLPEGTLLFPSTVPADTTSNGASGSFDIDDREVRPPTPYPFSLLGGGF